MVMLLLCLPAGTGPDVRQRVESLPQALLQSLVLRMKELDSGMVSLIMYGTPTT